MRRLMVLVLTLTLVLAGCATIRNAQLTPLTNPGPAAPPTTSPQAPGAKATANLYFPDNKAEKLLVEKRELPNPGPATPQAIVDQLIVGPKTTSNAVGMFPSGTTAKVTQADDLVTVDFSSEMNKFRVGSTGEALMINSILACLFELPSVQHVQILIDGEVKESLSGHLGIEKPFSRRSK